MDRKGYYTEGKYRCNHPESDFESTSTNPIELKREKYTEYTHRNETSNMQYDVWSGSNNTASLNNIDLERYKSTLNSNTYAQNRISTNYSTKNSYNTKKKSSGLGILFFFIFLYFGLPLIFAVLGIVFELLEDTAFNY